MKTVRSRKEDCSGCTACAFRCPVGAISMKKDAEGFLYPSINQELCTDCGLCREICPFHEFDHKAENLKHPAVFAAKHNDWRIRTQSSSGGVFTAISDSVLSQGGIVCGAVLDNSLTVTHKMAETQEQRDAMRGSKYVQSELGEIFKGIEENINKGRLVLFSGTPCQVAGLNAYLGVTSHPKLITMDLVCHGTPSHLLFHEFIAYNEKKRGRRVINYVWRSKVKGGHMHTEEISFKDGYKDYESFLSQINKRVFYSHLTIRPSCYNCHFAKSERVADITLADYWGIEKFIPEFCDGEGISLVLVNSAKGEALLQESEKFLELRESNLEDCRQRNSHLNKPTPYPPGREKFWEDYFSCGYKYVLQKYLGYTLFGKVKNTLLLPVLRKTGLLAPLRSLKASMRAHYKVKR